MYLQVDRPALVTRLPGSNWFGTVVFVAIRTEAVAITFTQEVIRKVAAITPIAGLVAMHEL